MDEDCDGSVLVIDLDDEREKDDVINIDDENIPINDNNVNNYIPTEDSVVKPDGSVIASPRNDDYNSDDDIQVIDDDDDYETSVRNLVHVANKVKKYRMQKSDKNNLINNKNGLEDPRTLTEQNPVNMDIYRDQVAYVKENQATERSGDERDVYQAHVMNYVPRFVDNNTYIQRTDEAYTLDPHAFRHINIHKAETINIDDYNAANRYAYDHIHRPIDLGNCYRDAARHTYRYIYRPDVLNIDDYGRLINRDIHNYEPEAFNMHDYRHALHRETNNVYIPTNQGYNCAPMDRDHASKPELSLSNYYRRTNMRACNTHQPEERYRQAPTRLTHTHAHVVDDVDDYWKTRHAYRPETVRIEDRHAEINRQYSNGYRPLSIDPYRSELNLYRPDLVNINALQPTVTRHTHPEAGMYYIPQVSHFNNYRPYDDAHKDEIILNLSRKQKSANTNTSRHEMDGSKLRTILSTGNYVSKTENPNLHVNKERKIETYRITADIRSNGPVLSTNNPIPKHINIGKPGVPVTNRSSTLWNAKNVCQKETSNTEGQTDVLATTNTMHDCYDYNRPIISKKNEKDALFIMHEGNEPLEGKQKQIVIERHIDKVEQDSNIRYLIVFFTRVKELVKETFPEFSKSLEGEIDNLGKVASNGKLKMDIQFICPLYCSVSTYSLSLFGSIDGDNKIEKHINRTEICDVCSCIQNSYKLYKKKIFNSLSNKKGLKRKMPLAGISRNREQTVICRQKITKCEENRCDNKLEINPARFNTEVNLHKAPHEHKNPQEFADDINNPLIRLNEKPLDSLSILSNVPNNITKTHNNSKNKFIIENHFQNIAPNEKEIINVNNAVDSPRQEAEEKLILSPSNETNADIITPKLNNSGRKADVFTCHICSCIFTYFASFVSHMQKEHAINSIDAIAEECTRKCPFCGIYSKQRYHNEHVRRAHPEIFGHKGEPTELLKVDRKRTKKRKFIFTCLVCHKNLKSREVKRHREKEHKGVNIAKMFTKKLSTMD